jgi:outer membrane protein assembly factor BamB
MVRRGRKDRVMGRAWWCVVCALMLPLLGAQPALQETSLNARLLHAVGRGDAAAVADLLSKGADVNAESDRGTTPLYIASEQGYVDVVRILLERGADPDTKDLELGRTPLRHAMISGNAQVKAARAEILRMLLEKGAGSEGESLPDLIEGGHLDAVRKIVARGRVDQSNLNVALDTAKRRKHTELVQFLTKAGAKELSELDSPRSPSRLKLLTGVYRSSSGSEITIRQGVHDDQLLLEQQGRPAIALLPLDFALLRSFDRKTVVAREVGPLPPPQITMKMAGRSEVFVRAGEAAPVTSTTRAAAPANTAPAARKAPPPSPVRSAASARDWPAFRGRGSSGIADGAELPTVWRVEDGQGIKWTTPIPGTALSSPIVFGDRVFVTTAVPSREQDVAFRTGRSAQSLADAENRSTRDDVPFSWRVYALDRHTGKILWERVAHEGVPKTQRHVAQTQANSTPATDGRHLVVWFGSEGLYCYDLDGKLLWKKDLGPLSSGYIIDPSYEWNIASSPVIYKDRVILQADLLKNSFIAAFDIKTGTEVWRTPRDEVPSWGTPLVYEGPTRTELVTAAPNFARGYDPATGKELWRLGKHSVYSAPSPIAGDGLIVITSGSTGVIKPIYAIRPGATGDITLGDDETANEWVLWSTLRGGGFPATPLLYRGVLYITTGSIVSAYQPETGERLYQQRLTRGGSFTASPVAGDGKVYFASEDGEVVVLTAGPTFERLAVNSMGALILATPAIAPNMIIFRTQRHVVAVAETPAATR